MLEIIAFITSPRMALSLLAEFSIFAEILMLFSQVAGIYDATKRNEAALFRGRLFASIALLTM